MGCNVVQLSGLAWFGLLALFSFSSSTLLLGLVGFRFWHSPRGMMGTAYGGVLELYGDENIRSGIDGRHETNMERSKWDVGHCLASEENQASGWLRLTLHDGRSLQDPRLQCSAVHAAWPPPSNSGWRDMGCILLAFCILHLGLELVFGGEGRGLALARINQGRWVRMASERPMAGERRESVRVGRCRRACECICGTGDGRWAMDGVDGEWE